MKSSWLAWVFGALCLLSACHDSFEPSAGDSNSNWLESCDRSADCADGLSCSCGVCTVACDEDATCAREGEAAAVCATTEELSCASGARSSVCLASCEARSECGAGLSCENEVCGAFVGDAPDAEVDMDGGALDAEVMDARTRDAEIDGNTEEPDSGFYPIWNGPGCEPATGERFGCEHDDPCEEGLVCHIDGTCIEPGKCDAFGQTTLAEVGDIYALRSDATHVYLLDRGGKDTLGNPTGEGAVIRIPLTGGALELVVMALVRPIDLLIDADEVLWFDGTEPRRVMRASKLDGSGANELVIASNVEWAQDATHVYFTADNETVGRSLSRIEKATGALEPLASNDAWSSTGYLAVDSSAVFFGTPDGLVAVPTSGGQPVGLGFGGDSTAELTAGADELYISIAPAFDGRVHKLPKTGGELTILSVLPTDTYPLGIAQHREHVYFGVQLEDESVDLKRAEIDPGETETLAHLPASARNTRFRVPFTINDRGLYWAQEGRLVRMVIAEYETLNGAKQGELGAPCFGDLSCGGGLACVDTLCE